MVKKYNFDVVQSFLFISNFPKYTVDNIRKEFLQREPPESLTGNFGVLFKLKNKYMQFLITSHAVPSSSPSYLEFLETKIQLQI